MRWVMLGINIIWTFLCHHVWILSSNGVFCFLCCPRSHLFFFVCPALFIWTCQWARLSRIFVFFAAEVKWLLCWARTDLCIPHTATTTPEPKETRQKIKLSSRGSIKSSALERKSLSLCQGGRFFFCLYTEWTIFFVMSGTGGISKHL